MRKSSKIFWIALVVVAMLVVTTLGAMASGTTDAVIYGELVEGAEGAFSVNYKIKNVDKEVECGKITLNWDSESTEVVDVEYASILGTAEYKAETGKAVIAWAGSEITEATPDGTTLFTVNFETTDEGVIPVTTTVDNFGTVGSFAIAYDCAEDVTANKVYASDNELANPTTLTVGVDGTIEAILASAMNYAQSVNVIVDLNGETWTITEDGSLGSAESIPANTITIQNGTIKQNANVQAGSYWIFTTVMYGNFVFDDITLGAYTNSNNQVSEFGGFVFPENCSGTFEDITQANALPNLYGNVTVKSGTYYMISGGFYANAGTRVGIGAVVNNPVIVVEGTTTVNRVVGGTFKTNVLESVTGRATVTVQGGASVTSELVAGAMFRKDSVGADLTVNTTGDVNAIISSAVAYGVTQGENKHFITTIENANVTGYVCGYRFNNPGSSYVNVTTNIEGGTFARIYGGSTSAEKGAVTLDGTTALNITGGTFNDEIYGGSYIKDVDSNHKATSSVTVNYDYEFPASTNVFGGSRFEAKGTHSGDITVNIVKGTFGKGSSNYSSVYGGSDTKRAVGLTTGNSTVNVSGGYFGKAVYGGSALVYGGSAHSGSSQVVFSGSPSFAPNYSFNGIYGGSSITGTSGIITHSGESKVIFEKTYTGTTDTYVRGGSFIEGVGTHAGDSLVEINNGTFKYNIFGGSYLRNGTEIHNADSALTINGGSITAAVVLAGSEGKGKIVGDSTFTMTGGTIAGATDVASPLGAGSYGLNDLADDDISEEYDMTGGIRQKGNLTFNLQGDDNTVITKWVQITGYKSNLDGDVTVNISGGKINQYLSVLGRGNTAAVTGDVMAYLTGGSIQYQFRGGEYAKVGGNFYAECSGSFTTGTGFFPGYYLNVQDKVYVKLIGNPAWHSGSYVDSVGTNDSVLDLVHYTGTTTFTTGKNLDKIIYPVVDISGITLTNTNVAPGQKLAELVPATLPASLTSGNVAYTYAEFTEFDGYTEYDNFAFYPATGENANKPITEVSPDPTQQVKFKVGSLTSEVITLDHVFKIANKSLELQDNLVLNFKVYENLFTEYGYSNPYLAINYKGSDKNLSVYKEVDSKNRYVYQFDDIAPQFMGEVASVVLCANYGDEIITSEVLEFSPKIYAYTVLNSDAYSSYTSLLTLLVDMLNYGAEAQRYKTYDVENLVNADLTDEQLALGSNEETLVIPESIYNKNYASAENATATIRGFGLYLESSVEVRYTIVAEDISNLTLKIIDQTNNGKVYTYTSADFVPVDGETNAYYVYFDYLNAGQMGNIIDAAVYNGDTIVSNTCRANIASYVALTYDKGYNFSDLVKKMYMYGVSAANY